MTLAIRGRFVRWPSVLGSSRWLPGRENTSRLIFAHAATMPWRRKKKIQVDFHGNRNSKLRPEPCEVVLVRAGAFELCAQRSFGALFFDGVDCHGPRYGENLGPVSIRALSWFSFITTSNRQSRPFSTPQYWPATSLYCSGVGAALNIESAVSAVVFWVVSHIRTTLPTAFRPGHWCCFRSRSISVDTVAVRVSRRP